LEHAPTKNNSNSPIEARAALPILSIYYHLSLRENGAFATHRSSPHFPRTSPDPPKNSSRLPLDLLISL
jgi:hypothetical protein